MVTSAALSFGGPNCIQKKEQEQLAGSEPGYQPGIFFSSFPGQQGPRSTMLDDCTHPLNPVTACHVLFPVDRHAAHTYAAL